MLLCMDWLSGHEGRLRINETFGCVAGSQRLWAFSGDRQELSADEAVALGQNARQQQLL
jgi:hypothetical protein